MQPQLISLKDIFKKTYYLIISNDNFGYIYKTFITYVFIFVLALLPFIIMAFVTIKNVSNLVYKSYYSYTQSFDTNIMPNPYSESLDSNIMPASYKNDMVAPPPAPVPNPQTFEGELNQYAKIMIGSFIVLVITILLLVIVTAAYPFMLSIYLYKNEKPRIKETINQVIRKSPKIFVLMILEELLILIGTLFFIIPGLLFLLLFMFAPLVMLEENLGIIGSLKRSAKLTEGYRLNLLGKGLLYMILISLLSYPLYFLIIGSFGLIIPAILTAKYLILTVLYFEIKKIKEEIPHNPATDIL